jgi:ferrous iron transport protein B
MPTGKAVFVHTWQRGWMYLRKAGTIILGASIILWAAANFPRPDHEVSANLSEQAARQQVLQYSLVGRIGQAIEPAIRPLGFDWKIGTALIGSIPAKELFVSQMGIIYAVGTEDRKASSLPDRLRADYTPLVGFCVMLFVLISAPCVATAAMTRQETGAWRWAAFQFVGLTGLAYVITFLVYQTGRALLG